MSPLVRIIVHGTKKGFDQRRRKIGNSSFTSSLGTKRDKFVENVIFDKKSRVVR
jgi:hypothetical protein